MTKEIHKARYKRVFLLPLFQRKLKETAQVLYLTVQETVQRNHSPKFCTVHQEERSNHADRITGKIRQAQREIVHASR